MRHASFSRSLLPVLLAAPLALLTLGPAHAQPKHTSGPHQPTHQYLAGQAFELLRHDPASAPEMLAEIGPYIGPEIVDWCFWKDDGDRFNVIYGGKENHMQSGAKESRCSLRGDQFVVPYADYTAAQWQNDNNNNAATAGTDGNDIIEGTQEEDQYDPLRQVYVAESLSACSFFSRHFWEPDDYDSGIFDTGLGQLSFPCPTLPDEAKGSAFNKADIYWTRAKSEYFLGNRDLAYYYLGRVVHLLEDMSSTPHTHLDPHPDAFGLFDDDEFEAYMGRKYDDWDHNPETGEVSGHRGFDNNYIRWGWDHTSKNSVQLTPVDPDNLAAKIYDEWYGSKFKHRGHDAGWPAWAFGHSQDNPAQARLDFTRRSRLFRLFYSLTETTDDFPSDGEDGDDSRYDLDNISFDVDDTKVVQYADTVLPAAIAHIAGLYRLFWNETHFPAPPTAMLLLLDRTGSMEQAIRPSTGNTRCRDALAVAREDARAFFAGGGSQAAVWTFADGIANLTGGFAGEAEVTAALDGLDPEGCDGNTPLAQAICAASDELSARFPTAPHGSRLLAISSDGGENSSSGACAGFDSAGGSPYDPGSWQQKTRDHVLRQSTVLSRFWNTLSKQRFNIETGNVESTDSDNDFFAELARVTGGVATTADDGGAFPPPFTPIPQDASCAGGLALDDGSFENAFASSDSFPGSVQYAMRFNTGAPTTLKSVCVCFAQRGHAAALPFTLAVLDDDGPQSSPGTTLAEVDAFAANVPTFPAVGFYRVDLSGLPTDGSFYIGPRWAPNRSQTKFWICADTTGARKLPAFFRFDQGAWDKLGNSASYSALGIRPTPACIPSDTTLCLNNGRFKVEAGWKNQGGTGAGHAVALTKDTGYFWFFDPSNVELVTKILTGCGANQRFWVFAGGLTDLETALTVTDTVAGTVKVYRNPPRTAFRPLQDTGAFDTCAAAGPAPAPPLVAAPSLPARIEPAATEAACVEGPTNLCLNGGRFRVSATWRTSNGSSGQGQAVRLTGDTGYFWFFDRENIEVVLKTLNACGLNNRFWVFAAGLTSVRTEITVEDTVTGITKKYNNPQGTPFQPIQDTQAFATCR
jgi:hypothetical protein